MIEKNMNTITRTSQANSGREVRHTNLTKKQSTTTKAYKRMEES